MFENIKSLVEFAYENVPLYRWLYGEKPELRNMGDFERLPCLTKNDFALCGIEDILSDPDEAIAILPPIEDKTIFPFPRLESAEDRDSRYEVFYFLLRQAGIPDGSSFLIITDSSHSYYCGEIANNLLYYGHPTWMMLLRDHSAHEVKEWIDRFQPDCLFLGLKWIPDWVLNCGITRIFTINSCPAISNIVVFNSVFNSLINNIHAVISFNWVSSKIRHGPPISCTVKGPP